MKIYIRGGVWSNVEDQVLLAAFMKYGGNQWLRIASLLPRKTASQVKARWEEYLDPTLRKTPWTQHEDEKLLHLARLMPMQWRTISQYFGRSAYQCVERYRELVDKASATPHYDDNDAAVIHEMMPNFETLNAVPDPVELDQDEKEMLAEARARLANTQGKKARRKARERQLDVMRKIVKLRKKRELIAAGIILEEKNMWEDKEFEVDVITTHEAKKGKFDTELDDKIAKQERENRIKKKIEERKKSKELKAKKQEKSNPMEDLGHFKEELIKEEAKLDLPYDAKHTDMILPNPQIGDTELKNIEALRHSNADFFERPRSLSLFSMSETAEETWGNEPEIEEDQFKTQAVQKELPRPMPVSASLINEVNKESIGSPGMNYFEDLAEKLVADEVVRLSFRDAKLFPPSGVKKMPSDLICPNDVSKYFNEMDDVGPLDLLRAQALINDEIAGKEPNVESFIEVWNKMHQNDKRINQTINLDDLIEKEEKTVAKLRKYYFQKSQNSDISCQNLLKKLNNEQLQLHKLARDKEMYREIQEAEKTMMKIRIESLTEKIKKLEAEQISVDSEYSRIVQEKKEAARKLKK